VRRRRINATTTTCDLFMLGSSNDNKKKEKRTAIIQLVIYHDKVDERSDQFIEFINTKFVSECDRFTNSFCLYLLALLFSFSNSFDY